MAYQMATTAVTLNYPEGHSRLHAFSNAIGRTFVQHFTQFKLTVCSHGFSALAGLLVTMHNRPILREAYSNSNKMLHRPRLNSVAVGDKS